MTNVTVGMIGLGRMGGNMGRRLARAGHAVVAWDRAETARAALADEAHVVTASSLQELVGALPAPRIAWLMLPAGAATDDTLDALLPLLGPGDVVVDGGNAFYRDSQRHALELGRHEIGFGDAGVSGGVWGLVARVRPHGRRRACGGARRRARVADAGARSRAWLGPLLPGRCGPLGKDGPKAIEFRMMPA